MFATKSADAADLKVEKQVMAFYYTWYGTPSYTGRWVHWEEGGHHPDEMAKPGHRDIGATNHPAPDVYDSNDPVLIRRQLALCEEMGIDALIATWWGINDYHDRALKVIIEEANTRQKTKLTVYYEVVPGPVGVASAVKDLGYILDTYGAEPAFLKRDGIPVIFVYGRAIHQLSATDWREVLSQVRTQRQVERSEIPSSGAIFIADSGSSELIELFDGGHSYNPVGAVARGDDMAANYIRNTRKPPDLSVGMNRVPLLSTCRYSLNMNVTKLREKGMFQISEKRC